jgi:hypothetical protein
LAAAEPFEQNFPLWQPAESENGIARVWWSTVNQIEGSDKKNLAGRVKSLAHMPHTCCIMHRLRQLSA